MAQFNLFSIMILIAIMIFLIETVWHRSVLALGLAFVGLGLLIWQLR